MHSDVQILDDWDRLCDDIESRPDWMTTQEKTTVLSFVQKEEREDVEL